MTISHAQIEKYLRYCLLSAILVSAVVALALNIHGASVRSDFDGDGKSDLAIYRPSDFTLYILGSRNGVMVESFYDTVDLRCVGDLDGNGSTDFWRQFYSTPRPWSARYPRLPGSTDLGVCRDYDGDHRDDLAFWNPDTGTWSITASSDLAQVNIQWGLSGDVPVADDYDGDGRADVAVYRPSNGTWYILKSSSGYAVTAQWGLPGDKPVFADYDGDGRAEIAMYRPSDNNWYMLMSRSNWATYKVVNWGAYGDVPVPGDYDGDGKYDVAQYRPVNGRWYVIASSEVQMEPQQWGAAADLPVPAMYLP